MEIFRAAIAARRSRWYALNMMRCKKQPRVAPASFCRNSYRCIHETVDQLQENVEPHQPAEKEVELDANKLNRILKSC